MYESILANKFILQNAHQFFLDLQNLVCDWQCDGSSHTNFAMINMMNNDQKVVEALLMYKIVNKIMKG